MFITTFLTGLLALTILCLVSCASAIEAKSLSDKYTDTVSHGGLPQQSQAEILGILEYTTSHVLYAMFYFKI